MLELHGTEQYVADSANIRAGHDRVNFTAMRSSTGALNDEYRFKIRLTDSLGQTSESEVRSINLLQLPDRIEFINAGNPAINKSIAQVGETLPIHAQVLDRNGRPVPNVDVTLELIDQERFRARVIGNLTSDSNGIVRYDWLVHAKAGNHKLEARALDVSGTSALRVLPGAVERINYSHIAPVVVGDSFSMELTALDAFGNRVNTENELSAKLVSNQPEFFFGFASNIQSRTLFGPEGISGAEGIVTLVNGRALVEMSAGTQAGGYQINVSYPDNNAIESYYDHDGFAYTLPVANSAIDFTAVHGDPARFKLSLVSHTNHQYGDAERLEAGEVATMAVVLNDKYGNQIHDLVTDSGREDADFDLQISVTGNASIDAVQNSNTVNMQTGGSSV